MTNKEKKDRVIYKTREFFSKKKLARSEERRSSARTKERRLNVHNGTPHHRPEWPGFTYNKIPSSLRLAAIIIISIFIAQAIVMTFIVHASFPTEVEILLDSTMLVILTLPPIYFFLLKPMISSMKEQKLLEENLKNWSFTDELTGLYNRRGFFSLADHELKHMNRNKENICLIYLDFDGLKWINDTFGHEMGDKALVETADIFKKCFRKSDLITRLGGDEFVVLPLGSTKKGIDKITARLESMLKKHNAIKNKPYKLSLSLGAMCGIAGTYNSINDLMVQADDIMYQNKTHKKQNSYHPENSFTEKFSSAS